MGATGRELSTGSVVAGRYRLIRRVGEGAMGVVWEAEHAVTRKRLALKVLKSASREARARFEREVRATAVARHPNVVDVHDFLEEPDGALCIVMDFLEGETLGDMLRRNGAIGLEELAAILVPAISAVGSAHAHGIIHRDIKPDNVFVGRGADTVKVLDFGVAKLTSAEGVLGSTRSLTHTGSVLGTPYYMSPEQVFAERDIDARADVWSFGIVIYECLSGVRPTEEANVGRVMRRIMNADFVPLAERCPDLPAEVAQLVMRMLSPRRDDRPRDLREVLSVIQRYTAVRAPAFDAPAEIARPAPDSNRGVSSDPAEATLRYADDDRSDTHSPVLLGALGRSPRRVGIAAMTLVAIAATGWLAFRRPGAQAPLDPLGVANATASERPAEGAHAVSASRAAAVPPAPSGVGAATAAGVPVAGEAGSSRGSLAAGSAPPSLLRAPTPHAPSATFSSLRQAPARLEDGGSSPPPAPRAPPDNGGIVDVPPF